MSRLQPGEKVRKWNPTMWGKTLTRSEDWSLSLDGDHLLLAVQSRKFQAIIQKKSPIAIRQGVFWADITFPIKGKRRLTVDGIPNAHSADIAAAIELVVRNKIAEERQQAEGARRVARQRQFKAAYGLAAGWREMVLSDIRKHNVEQRWVTSEQVEALLAARPDLALTDDAFNSMFDDATLQQLNIPRDEAQKVAALWRADLSDLVAGRNEKHVQAELERHKTLFASVESKPLTEDQARAAICFDNRVQLVAAAGSGKTSTIVAKAVYAVECGQFTPDQILMLSFNNAAAKELSARTKLGFERAGLAGITIKASTFHSFGSMVIGQASGTRKRVPQWMDHDDGLGKLAEIVDDLKGHDKEFQTRWDLFRVVFSRDIPLFGEKVEHEDWDRSSKKTGFLTLSGDIVKSLEELTLADWLFYQGVEFEYERNYEHPTADSDHSQYRPDFYYPSINLYHEHFALDKHGHPPKTFEGYMDGVLWKRKIHQDYWTKLFETTSAQMYSGELFKNLAKKLTDEGVHFEPNPDRQSRGRKVIENRSLVSLFRTFLSHAKSNDLSIEDLRKRLKQEPEDAFSFRHKMFLDLYAPIRLAWERALAESDGIDYEDMLIQSAEALETGAWCSPYRLVMVDEFQDASWARARMARALAKESGRFLFVVGDDWQSINRFAGADVSVMTGFLDWCERGQVLRLEETFRCPQELCDASSKFVQQNPAQINKTVHSRAPKIGSTLQAFQVPERRQLADAIETYLHTLYESLASGKVPAGKNGHVTLYILGRYNNDKQYVPRGWQRSYGDLIDISFRTIHQSKGSESDYVVLPGMVKRGFPSYKQDDPVLQLAMPSYDTYYQAEERRLFYVALTRARRSVAMFTVEGQISEFLIELVREREVDILDTTGEPIDSILCPACNKGLMVQRTSQYGAFLGCSNYPLCSHIINQ